MFFSLGILSHGGLQFLILFLSLITISALDTAVGISTVSIRPIVIIIIINLSRPFPSMRLT